MSKLDMINDNIKQLKNKVNTSNHIGVLKVFATLMMVCVFVWQGVLFIGDEPSKQDPHIAVIKIDGSISAGAKFGDGIRLSQAIKNAYENESAAIIIEANSPGGSPVQAEIINATILDYLASHPQKPIYFMITDVCASACLYIAAAVPKIYAHSNSIIGSIGVKLESFGVVELMNNIGVERRSYSAGDHKTLLDPFLAENESVKTHISNELLEPLFKEFKTAVTSGRGNKLSSDHRVLSGLIWGGKQAKELGLIDDIESAWRLRERLSKQMKTDTFIVYNDDQPRLTDLLTASFWSDTIVETATRVTTQHLHLH